MHVIGYQVDTDNDDDYDSESNPFALEPLHRTNCSRFSQQETEPQHLLERIDCHDAILSSLSLMKWQRIRSHEAESSSKGYQRQRQLWPFYYDLESFRRR